MNIVFPINGLGKRFSVNGYTEPKPFIKVLGEEMIINVLNSFDFDINDNLYISYHRDLKNYNFEEVVSRKLKDKVKKINFFCINHDTNGAAETLSKSLEEFGISGEEVLIADCDVIYGEPVIEKFRGQVNSCIGVSYNDESEPIYSYVNINENNFISNIKEKEKISNDACCGLYYFSKKNCSEIFNIVNRWSEKREMYISDIYKDILNRGQKVNYKRFNNLDCVGTPIQLQSYCCKNVAKERVKNLRVCFDLDNTLVTYPKTQGDYSTVDPILNNIRYLKQLKENGAYIIIHTARRMRTHKGNIGSLIQDVGEITLKTLRDFDIPYDEIVFGKPWANFYIDDLAISADKKLDKSIGYYFNNINPRPAHSIKYTERFCVKTGYLDGESFWYNNCPEDILKKLVPNIYECDESKIKLDKIYTPPLSQLYVRDCFDKTILIDIFNSLEKIHSHKPSEINFNPYENYTPKLESRKSDILKSNPKALDVINESIEELSKLKIEDDELTMIHGDPVFSNIFCFHSGKINFIDPKGKCGDVLTIYGHNLYDYAKVYQSIIGYDFVLLDQDIDLNTTKEYKKEFEKLFLQSFSVDKLLKVKIIVKSLLISLIPLHEKRKSSRYLDLIRNI